MEHNLTGGQLRLRCYKCTRETLIPGTDKESCAEFAFTFGWVADERGMICAKCPAVRDRSVTRAA